MPRRLSRRPGPEHPVLFTDASDIPVPIEPTRPRAAAQMVAYRGLLTAAEAVELAALTERSIGRSVTIAGERRPRDALTTAELLLDDGTAVVGLTTRADAPRSVRESLSARFLLVTGTVHERDGELQVQVEQAGDLRTLARDWPPRR